MAILFENTINYIIFSKKEGRPENLLGSPICNPVSFTAISGTLPTRLFYTAQEEAFSSLRILKRFQTLNARTTSKDEIALFLVVKRIHRLPVGLGRRE
jgi:hypothetical protein